MIPDLKQCLHLMEHHRMPAHIREHSLLVARIAEVLARLLREQGWPMQVELAVAGALLHDIAKVLCLDGSCDHALLGREICREHGYSELGPLVAEHVILRQGFTGLCRERELVYYADKRVCHQAVVSLEQRRDDIIRRYAANDPPRQELIHRNFGICRRLEKHIFAELPLEPAELGVWLSDERV